MLTNVLVAICDRLSIKRSLAYAGKPGGQEMEHLFPHHSVPVEMPVYNGAYFVEQALGALAEARGSC